MAMQISVPNPIQPELRPRITVVGVGGAGGNAVSNMIRANLSGVEFVVANTDAQALSQALAETRIQLGNTITRGLGAGARAEVGRAAAEEAIEEIMEQLTGSNMVFITAGMGGGTGTGAAPVIARAARERGVLTVGVVTKPFQFEGAHRMRQAEDGIKELQQYVDTLIVIPNQNLFRLANERTTFADAFKMADDVLHSGVRGVTDLMVNPGMINLDFADIRSVMSEMGKAMMGTGEGQGDRRALDAAEAAISNPLLDDTSMKGARALLINVTGGMDLTLFEVDEAANRIRDEVDPDANIIFGSTLDETMSGKVRVSVVATGIEAEAMSEPRRPQLSVVADRSRPGFVSGSMPAGTPAGSPMPSPAVASAAMGSGMSYAAPTMSAGAAPTMSGSAAPAGQPSMGQASTNQPTMGRYESHGGAAVAYQHEPMPEPTPEPKPAAAAPQPTAPAMSAPRVQLKPEAPSRPVIPSAATQQRPADQPFIAPPPVHPGNEAQQSRQADAFAEAAMVNRPAEKAEKPTTQREPAKDKQQSFSLFRKVTQNMFSQSAAPAAAAAPAATAAPAAGGQIRLGAPEQAERLTGSTTHADDDLLDIPAFLRRQAN